MFETKETKELIIEIGNLKQKTDNLSNEKISLSSQLVETKETHRVIVNDYKFKVRELESELQKLKNESLVVPKHEYEVIKSRVSVLAEENQQYKKMVDHLQELPAITNIYSAIEKLKLPSMNEISDVVGKMQGLGKIELDSKSIDRIVEAVTTTRNYRY